MLRIRVLLPMSNQVFFNLQVLSSQNDISVGVYSERLSNPTRTEYLIDFFWEMGSLTSKHFRGNADMNEEISSLLASIF